MAVSTTTTKPHNNAAPTTIAPRVTRRICPVLLSMPSEQIVTYPRARKCLIRQGHSITVPLPVVGGIPGPDRVRGRWPTRAAGERWEDPTASLTPKKIWAYLAVMRRRSISAMAVAGVASVAVWNGVAVAQPTHSAGVRTAHQAIVIASHDASGQGVGRTQNISAKLTTFGYESSRDEIGSLTERPSEHVWVVGFTLRSLAPVVGVVPPTLRVPPSHGGWAVMTIDRRSGHEVSFVFGPGPLPGWYRRLR